MIAIRRDDVIVWARRGDCAGDDGFLPDIKMTEAANLLRLILLTRTFFETPDQQHHREHLDFVALLGLLHRNSLGSARNCRGRVDAIATAAKAHAGNKKQGEEQIAQKRVAEEHPGGRRSVSRQADGQRLNQTGKSFCIAGISQPRKNIGDEVKKRRADKRSRNDCFQRDPISNRKTEAADQRCIGKRSKHPTRRGNRD